MLRKQMFFYSCPVILSSLPLRGSYCFTVSVVLAYIQSLPGLSHRLSLVADGVIICSIGCRVVQQDIYYDISNIIQDQFDQATFPFAQRLCVGRQFFRIRLTVSQVARFSTFYKALMSNILCELKFALEKDLACGVFRTLV